VQQSSAVSNYLESLCRELSFDPVLAHRVRVEVEDHLWEAVAADPEDDKTVALRRAIESFGRPREIASQMKALSQLRQAKKAAVNLLSVIAGILVFMEMRTLWFAGMRWSGDGHWIRLTNAALAIDRYTFLLSALIAMLAWMYVRTRTVTERPHGAWRAQLRWCIALFAVATGVLTISVTSDGVFTLLRLVGSGFSGSSFVPLSLIAVELACAGLLIAHIRRIAKSIFSAGAAVLR
jgi:hypothetical protein